jgi:hypothetical protein
MAAVALLVAQTGCTALQVVHTPGSELATAREGKTTVIQADGRRVALTGAHVQADTIYGMDMRGRKYKLSVHDAEAIDVRRFSATRTALLGVIVVAAATGVVMAARGGNGPVQFVFTNCSKFPDSMACQPAN